MILCMRAMFGYQCRIDVSYQRTHFILEVGESVEAFGVSRHCGSDWECDSSVLVRNRGTVSNNCIPSHQCIIARS